MKNTPRKLSVKGSLENADAEKTAEKNRRERIRWRKTHKVGPSNSPFVLGNCLLFPDTDAMFLTAGTTGKPVCRPIAYVE